MLSADSSRLAHAWQNTQLLVLSALLLPLSTALVCVSYLVRPFFGYSPEEHRRHVRSTYTPYVDTRTILITGVGMTKGLALARLFYAAGHNVIGADFESGLVPSTCGRVSRSLKKFRKLAKPDGSIEGSARYAQSLLDIIRDEKVDLWVSCSGVASAVDDGRAKEMIELITSCKAIQYDVAMTKTLHEKHSFIDFTKSHGLSTPETYAITSHSTAIEILDKAQQSGIKYIMKYTGTDDSVRGDMTLLPFSSPTKTEAHISNLPISPSRPWVLQQYIAGPEYCTHALVVNNTVKAFVACPSAELLMHYTALPADSTLSRNMLRWTQEFTSSCPPGFTGRLSFDFLLNQDEHDNAVRGKTDTVKLYPIECNPRAHTAVALFANTPAMISEGYMSIFDAPKRRFSIDNFSPKKINGTFYADPVFPIRPAKYYWIQNDLVELVLQPVLSLLRKDGMKLSQVLDSVGTFVEHLLYWRDGTFEIWDPLPAWWLWTVSWPWIFFKALITGEKWSRVNVSTMKVFGC